MLVAKSGIEAAFAQACGRKNISKRSSFVSFGPEHVHGTAQRLRRFKFLRSRHPPVFLRNIVLDLD